MLDVAQDEADIFLKAIAGLHAKSQATKISEINSVKNQIDSVCN